MRREPGVLNRVTKRALLVVAPTAILAVGVVAASSAAAETCNADQTICLLTDTSSPEHPLQLPAPVSVRVPAVTTPGLGWRPGPSTGVTGGFKIESRTDDWTTFPPRTTVQATLEPGPGLTSSSPTDGQITMYVEAHPYGSCVPPFNICDTLTADFPLWVMASAVDMSATLKRQGRRYVATLGFTGRIPLAVEFRLGMKALRRYRCGKRKFCTGPVEIPRVTRSGDVPELGPGRHELTQQLPVRLVERECRFRVPCEVLLTAYVLRIGGIALGVFERSLNVPVKKKRKRGQPPKTPEPREQ